MPMYRCRSRYRYRSRPSANQFSIPVPTRTATPNSDTRLTYSKLGGDLQSQSHSPLVIYNSYLLLLISLQTNVTQKRSGLQIPHEKRFDLMPAVFNSGLVFLKGEGIRCRVSGFCKPEPI